MKRILFFALFFCLIALMSVMADEKANYTVGSDPVLIQLSLGQGSRIEKFLGTTINSFKMDCRILSLETISYETAVPEISFIGFTNITEPYKTSFINFSPGIVFT